jgi:hypothetical protein
VNALGVMAQNVSPGIIRMQEFRSVYFRIASIEHIQIHYIQKYDVYMAKIQLRGTQYMVICTNGSCFRSDCQTDELGVDLRGSPIDRYLASMF